MAGAEDEMAAFEAEVGGFSAASHLIAPPPDLSEPEIAHSHVYEDFEVRGELRISTGQVSLCPGVSVTFGVRALDKFVSVFLARGRFSKRLGSCENDCSFGVVGICGICTTVLPAFLVQHSKTNRLTTNLRLRWMQCWTRGLSKNFSGRVVIERVLCG